MAGASSFEEWLDENEDRAYPISESATRSSIDRSGSLPNSLIVDARLAAPPTYFGGDFFISMVEILADFVTVEISYQEGETPPEKVSFVRVEASSHETHNNYAFSGSGPHRSILGTLTIGDIQKAAAESRGVLLFSVGASRLEMSVVHISQPAVDHITVLQNSRIIARLTGVVGLSAGANIRLTRTESGNIRIDAISGENLSACDDPGANGPPVKSINGVLPDENGDLWLSGSECISVSRGSQNSLLIRDLCSTSCCGCRELATLIDSLRELETQSVTVRDLVYRGYADQSSMIASLTAFIAR